MPLELVRIAKVGLLILPHNRVSFTNPLRLRLRFEDWL